MLVSFHILHLVTLFPHLDLLTCMSLPSTGISGLRSCQFLVDDLLLPLISSYQEGGVVFPWKTEKVIGPQVQSVMKVYHFFLSDAHICCSLFSLFTYIHCHNLPLPGLPVLQPPSFSYFYHLSLLTRSIIIGVFFTLILSDYSPAASRGSPLS